MPETNPNRRFPCPTLPDDPGQARLLGLYPQVQPGRWMQRIRVPGGVLSPAQWSALAALAREHTPATPLHLTTRQEIELHDLTAGGVAAAQADIASLGLTGAGACGDTFRNITVCPCAGTRPDSVELLPAAHRIAELLGQIDGIYALPRKFKVALSCGDDCGQPYINDLGLVAHQREGRWGFAAIGAGSLGARPATGIELFDWVAPARVLPLVAAAIGVFAAHGDRRNRRRARFRHIRQRLGDAAFRELLGAAVEKAEQVDTWTDVPLPAGKQALPAAVALAFPGGDLSGEAAEALADLSATAKVEVRIGVHHQVHVFGSSACALREHLAAFAALPADRTDPNVVACPGRHWCARGLVDTRGLADRVRDALAGLGRADATVCISGCPNGCAHSRVADVGLTGRVVGKADRREAFDVYVGGGRGRTDVLATPHTAAVPAADAPTRVRELLTGHPHSGGSHAFAAD